MMQLNNQPTGDTLIEACKRYCRFPGPELEVIFPSISQIIGSKRRGISRVLQLLYWMLEASKADALVVQENQAALLAQLTARLPQTSARDYPAMAYWLGRLIRKAGLSGNDFVGTFRTLLNDSDRAQFGAASQLIWGIGLAGLYTDLLDSRIAKRQGTLISLVGITDLLPHYPPVLDSSHTQKVFFDQLCTQLPNLDFQYEALINGFYVDILLTHQGCYLVIEIDGLHHLDPLQRCKDSLRDSALAALGFQVIRLSCVDTTVETLVAFAAAQIQTWEAALETKTATVLGGEAGVNVPQVEVIRPPERKVLGYLQAVFDCVEGRLSATDLVARLISPLPEWPGFSGLFVALSNEEISYYFATQVLNHPGFIAAFQNNPDARQALFQPNGQLGDVLSLLLVSWEGQQFVLNILPFLVEHHFPQLLGHSLWIQAVFENTPGFIEKLGESFFFKTMNWEIFQRFLSSQNAETWAQQGSFQDFFLSLEATHLAELTQSPEGAILLAFLQSSSGNDAVKNKIESAFFAINHQVATRPESSDPAMEESGQSSEFILLTSFGAFYPHRMSLSQLSAEHCTLDTPNLPEITFFSIFTQSQETLPAGQLVLLQTKKGGADYLTIESIESLQDFMNKSQDFRDPSSRLLFLAVFSFGELPASLLQELAAQSPLHLENFKERIFKAALFRGLQYCRPDSTASPKVVPKNLYILSVSNPSLLTALKTGPLKNRVALLEAVSKNPGFSEQLEQNEPFRSQWLSLFKETFLTPRPVVPALKDQSTTALRQLLVQYKDNVFPWNSFTCSAFAQELIESPELYPALVEKFQSSTALEFLLAREEGQLFFLAHIWPQYSDRLLANKTLMSSLSSVMPDLAKYPEAREFFVEVLAAKDTPVEIQQCAATYLNTEQLTRPEIFKLMASKAGLDLLTDKILAAHAEHEASLETWSLETKVILVSILSVPERAKELTRLLFDREKEIHPKSCIFTLARTYLDSLFIISELLRLIRTGTMSKDTLTECRQYLFERPLLSHETNFLCTSELGCEFLIAKIIKDRDQCSVSLDQWPGQVRTIVMSLISDPVSATKFVEKLFNLEKQKHPESLIFVLARGMHSAQHQHVLTLLTKYIGQFPIDRKVECASFLLSLPSTERAIHFLESSPRWVESLVVLLAVVGDFVFLEKDKLLGQYRRMVGAFFEPETADDHSIEENRIEHPISLPMLIKMLFTKRPEAGTKFIRLLFQLGEKKHPDSWVFQLAQKEDSREHVQLDLLCCLADEANQTLIKALTRGDKREWFKSLLFEKLKSLESDSRKKLVEKIGRAAPVFLKSMNLDAMMLPAQPPRISDNFVHLFCAANATVALSFLILQKCHPKLQFFDFENDFAFAVGRYSVGVFSFLLAATAVNRCKPKWSETGSLIAIAAIALLACHIFLCMSYPVVENVNPASPGLPPRQPKPYTPEEEHGFLREVNEFARKMREINNPPAPF